MQATLVVVGGRASRAEIAIDLPMVLGRSAKVGLTVGHPLISRKHCMLFEQAGLVMVRDLSSSNGTYVGGERINEAVLRPGDEFTIGPLRFRVLYQLAEDAEMPPTVEGLAEIEFTPYEPPATGPLPVSQSLFDELPEADQPAAASPAKPKSKAPKANLPEGWPAAAKAPIAGAKAKAPSGGKPMAGKPVPGKVGAGGVSAGKPPTEGDPDPWSAQPAALDSQALAIPIVPHQPLAAHETAEEIILSPAPDDLNLDELAADAADREASDTQKGRRLRGPRDEGLL